MMTQTLERVRRLSPQQKGLLLEQIHAYRVQPPPLRWSPLVPLQPNERGEPIYFVHPMGSALFFYLPLLKQLGSQYNLHGIQGHGLDDEQVAMDSIPAMASCYLEAIKERQPQTPVHLVGYSMGGLIAFEMAQQLRRQGGSVGLLALIDSYAFTKRIPYPGKEIKDEDERLLTRLAMTLDAGQSRHLRRVLKPMASNRERIDHVVQLAKQAGKVPGSYSVTDLRRMFDSYDAHLSAVENYHPQPYAGKVFFLQCQDTSDTHSIPSLPWNKLVPSGLIQQRVAGKHSTVMNEPQVQGVATCLRLALKSVGIE